MPTNSSASSSGCIGPSNLKEPELGSRRWIASYASMAEGSGPRLRWTRERRFILQCRHSGNDRDALHADLDTTTGTPDLSGSGPVRLVALPDKSGVPADEPFPLSGGVK